MASENHIYKMSNAGGMSSLTRYSDMLAGNPTWVTYDGPFGAYDALATVTVPSGGAASIDFAGIPSGYKHLQVRVLARGARTPVTYDNFIIRFNSDTGNSYSYHAIYGDARAGGPFTDNSTSASFISAGNIPGAASLANSFGVAVIEILDYADISKNKTMRSLNGYDSNTTGYNNTFSTIALNSGAWYNTAAITSITFIPSNSPFQEFSSFALYGVK